MLFRSQKVSTFWVVVSEKEKKISSNVSVKNNVANIGDAAKVVVKKKKKKKIFTVRQML